MSEDEKIVQISPVKTEKLVCYKIAQTPTELAEEHWKFLEKWLHLVFVDAFIHGFKHAMEIEENKGAVEK